MQNQRRIFTHILTLIPKLADAEEVFQQASVIILDKADQFVSGTNFVRWACQIAHYEAYNYRRRLQRERLRFSDELLEVLAQRRLDNSETLQAELDALQHCVEKLPLADRHLIRERYQRDISSRALAAELGRPENTVYKAIHRIRRLLRACVERSVGRTEGSLSQQRLPENPT
jgi:RNA polymerase sigma-70 factor (ECF subfamily)